MNILLLKLFKNINTIVLKAVVKYKTFDLFLNLVLYKYNNLFCPKKCFAFFFHQFNLLKAQNSINKGKIIWKTFNF